MCRDKIQDMYVGQEFKLIKSEISLALDGGMNGFRSNCYRLSEKQN